LCAFHADARETASIQERREMRGVGKFLALTDNEDLNELLCKKWEPAFGKTHVYRWASKQAKQEDVNNTGIILWSWMPKPSMISSEIMLGEAAIVELQGERLSNPGNLAALMTAHPAEVLLDPGTDSNLKPGKVDAHTLYLQREADYLLNALSPGRMLIVRSIEPHVVYQTLANRLAEGVPSVEGDQILSEVLERESIVPTTLGHGVALPHAKLPGIKATVCAIGLVPDGVVLGSEPDPVRLVFMLASPVEEPEMHLAVLGEIARLCADADVRQKLMDCTSADEILPIIRQYRRQHTPFAQARG
jgi:mannitol/fructose-specific phosphotransferase system IIA component (Ntr-type)